MFVQLNKYHPYTFKIPKHYKQNKINGNLYHSKRTSSNFKQEIPQIYEKPDYPLSFIISVVNECAINCVLPKKGIVLVVHVTLVKPSATQKLDGMNTIIQLNIQNRRNFFDAKLATVLHGK